MTNEVSGGGYSRSPTWEKWKDTEGDVAVIDRPSTGGDSKLGTWWTVKVEPYSCGCGFTSDYACTDTKPHRIIVWPSEDDPNLTKYLQTVEADGVDFDIVEYEQSMGAAVSFYAIHPR